MSSDKKKIYIAFLWHMHQPWYIEPNDEVSIMPWVRLHALKDYYDMPWIASHVPKMKMTFNLVPSLIEQIELYLKGNITDTFLEHFKMHPSKMDKAQKHFLLEHFFSANKKNQIEVSARYKEIHTKVHNGQSIDDFNDTELFDLQMHFELAWFGEYLRTFPEIEALIEKDKKYTQEDKDIILEHEHRIFGEILELYKKLHDDGQIEITTTPYYHPILPILYDSKNIKLSDPTSPEPDAHYSYPVDAEYQIQHAIEYFEEILGFKPQGMWPSEGSVSKELIPLFEKHGIKWIATDEEILHKSGIKDTLFKPYIAKNGNSSVKMFFRDHKLSDRIGFNYSTYNEKEAVKEFLTFIRGIADSVEEDTPHVVSIILDGENAWEYYKNNGFDFLKHLYTEIANSGDIVPITFSDYLKLDNELDTIASLSPGSWIGGNFRTWSGDPDKNKGWDILAKTRKLVEENKHNCSPETLREVMRHIYIAEGSDWFWWYGEGNHTDYLAEFDRLFRMHQEAALDKLGLEKSPELDIPIFSEKRGITPVRECISFIKPIVDGRNTSYYEWEAAGMFLPTTFRGTMHGDVTTIIKTVYFGFDQENLYLRIDGDENVEHEILDRGFAIRFRFIAPQDKAVIIYPNHNIDLFMKGKPIKRKTAPHFAVGESLEIAIPFLFIGAKPGNEINFIIELFHYEEHVESMPSTGFLSIKSPDETFGMEMWYV